MKSALRSTSRRNSLSDAAFGVTAKSLERAVGGYVVAEAAVGVVARLFDLQFVAREVHRDEAFVAAELTGGVLGLTVVKRNCNL